MLGLVQICLRDHQYAQRLSQYLRADTTFEDCEVISGEPEELLLERGDGVCVIDVASLPDLPKQLNNPAKTVLIVSGTVNLEQIWQSGIVSILQSNESLEYVKLAILAALLRPDTGVPVKKLKRNLLTEANTDNLGTNTSEAREGEM
ncbi:MAG: hypothetical protein HY313_02945 [Acidobacteria bacterium]|nr:hypothetical protein [Acidobacteriota bacterium]